MVERLCCFLATCSRIADEISKYLNPQYSACEFECALRICLPYVLLAICRKFNHHNHRRKHSNYMSPVAQTWGTRCERKRVAFASSAAFSLPNGQAFRVSLHARCAPRGICWKRILLKLFILSSNEWECHSKADEKRWNGASTRFIFIFAFPFFLWIYSSCFDLKTTVRCSCLQTCWICLWMRCFLRLFSTSVAWSLSFRRIWLINTETQY